MYGVHGLLTPFQNVRISLLFSALKRTCVSIAPMQAQLCGSFQKNSRDGATTHSFLSPATVSRARPLLRICGMNIILQREAVRRRTGRQRRRWRQRRLQRRIGNVGKNERRPRRTNNPAAGRTRAGRSRVGHRRWPIDGHSIYSHLRRGADFQGTPPAQQGRWRCSRRWGRRPPRLNSGEPGRHRLRLLWRLIRFRGRG